MSRLIGAPPGYVGHDAGGQLTEAVRRRPYNVVLFDEVEKAHKDVWNVLLQVLDDGRLTDSHGRTVDFSNTIIILTSNLGSHFLLDDAMRTSKKQRLDNGETKERRNAAEDGENRTRLEAQVMGVVKKFFRPEFLNRLDECVIFDPLQKASLRKIVLKQVALLGKRLEDRDVTLQISDAACDVVLNESYDPLYGARPVQRYLEKEVTTKLSRHIISGHLQENSILEIATDRNGNLSFKSTRKPGRVDAMEEA